MTLTIVSRPITEERLREIAGPISAYVSVPASESYSAVAEVQRRDYSHLIVEGTRGGDGVLRYFARIDRGARISVASGERITAVYYGDEDGDGTRDVIVRMESGALQVFLVREVAAAAPGSGATAPPPEAYDPEGETSAQTAPSGPRNDRSQEDPPSSSEGSGLTRDSDRVTTEGI